MKDYGTIKGKVAPQAIEITPTSVLVASNVEPYTEVLDDRTVSGYKYHYVAYTKDEFLLQQNTILTALQEELAAAKILLGVD